MESPSDEKLFQDYLAGDRVSLELLVHRHSAELYQFAARLTGNPAAAEDTVQDAWARVCEFGHRFDPRRRFKTWLFAIALNRARDWLRQRERRKEVSFESFLNQEEKEGRRFIDFLGSELGPAGESSFSIEETRRLVRRVVADIPLPLKEVLILAYFHNCSYKDIAEVVGIKVGTVKSRLHTALGEFRSRLEEALRAKRDEE